MPTAAERPRSSSKSICVTEKMNKKRRTKIIWLCVVVVVAGFMTWVVLGLLADLRVKTIRGSADRLSEVPGLNSFFRDLDQAINIEYVHLKAPRTDQVFVTASAPKEAIEEWLDTYHPKLVIYKDMYPQPPDYFKITINQFETTRDSWTRDCWIIYGPMPGMSYNLAYDPNSGRLWGDFLLPHPIDNGDN